MNKTKIRRPGSGRTKGSFSFVPLTLTQMQTKIADPNFKFLVSRKQAETLGFTGLTTGSVGELTNVTTPETEVKIKSTEF